MFTRAILLLFLTSAAFAETITVPGSQLSYDYAGTGERCLQAFVTDAEGDESQGSNIVCKQVPATWTWQAPTENVDGSPVSLLDSYRLVFVDSSQPPIPPIPPALTAVVGLLAGSWTSTPRVSYFSMPTFDFDGTQHVDAGNFSVPGQSLDITAHVIADPTLPIDDHARIISKANGVDRQSHDFMLSQYNGGRARFRLRSQGNTHELVGTSAIPRGVLTEVRGTYDGIKMNLYVNGVLEASRNKTGDMDQSNKAVWVGMNPDNYSPWIGSIAVEVR